MTLGLSITVPRRQDLSVLKRDTLRGEVRARIITRRKILRRIVLREKFLRGVVLRREVLGRLIQLRTIRIGLVAGLEAWQALNRHRQLLAVP